MSISWERSRPIRIFYFITEFDIGGAERCLWELARGMKRRGHDVHACALSGRGPVGDWLARDGVAVLHLDARGKYDATCVFRLASILRRLRVDVFHSFLFHANLIGRIAARLARVPVSIGSIRVAEKRRRSHLVLDRLTIGLVDVEVAVSESVAAFTRDVARIPENKLTVIGNAVDVERFQGIPRGVLRRSLGLGDEAFLIGFIGRLERQKGLDILLEAFTLVRSEIPHARLIVVGAGREETQLRSLAQRLGLGAGATFLGWRSDIPQILADLDLLAAPSRWEGMSNVILEALAAGVPVVATDSHGMREILGVGLCAELLDAAPDPKTLARAILQLAASPERRGELAVQGVERVASAFSVGAMVRRCERLYAEVLTRKM